MAPTSKEFQREREALEKRVRELVAIVDEQKRQLEDLDRIARNLVQRDSQFVSLKQQQQEQIKTLDATAKRLIKKEREFTAIRDIHEAQIQELDATAKRLVQRDFELSAANERLLEVDRLKSEFVSLAAHQLRTPVSVVKWTFAMLLGGDFGQITAEQRQSIKQAQLALDSLVKLIADLLNVSRIESGRFAYNKTKLGIISLVKDVASAFTHTAKTKNLIFKLNFPKDKEIFIL